MSTKHCVRVIYDGLSLAFKDAQGEPMPPIELHEDDDVILSYEGIPDDTFVPQVTFFHGDTISALGPFLDVLQTSDQIILRGNNGVSGRFDCQTWLSLRLRGERQTIHASEPLVIEGKSSYKAGTEICVTIKGNDDVEVDVEKIELYEHDSVIWSFVFEPDLEPARFLPLLYLDPDSPKPPGAGPFGPFESLSTRKVFNTLEDGRILAYRLITSGTNKTWGTHHFKVGVEHKGPHQKLMRSFATTDPIIDYSGPPHYSCEDGVSSSRRSSGSSRNASKAAIENQRGWVPLARASRALSNAEERSPTRA